MFYRKQLSGHWSTDTLDGRIKSLEGNRYAQVFSNKGYFSKLYPMDKKSEAGNALRLICRELGIPVDATSKQIQTNFISIQTEETTSWI